MYLTFPKQGTAQVFLRFPLFFMFFYRKPSRDKISYPAEGICFLCPLPDAPPTAMPAVVVAAPESNEAETVSNGAWPLALNFRPAIHLTDEQFFTFCQINRDLNIEQDAQGKVVIMAPAGGGSSARNGEMTRVLGNWVVHNGTGRFFDSSGGFILPNGAKRSPDASWVLKTRLAALTPEQREQFLPLCPDFVAEIRSPSDAHCAIASQNGRIPAKRGAFRTG